MTTPIDYDGRLTLSIPVSDMNKSIAWYQDTLGFELLYKMDEMGWCEMSTGVDGVNLGLSVTEETKPGETTPTFGVRDIEAARATLENKQVKLDGEVQTIPDMVSLQTFYDPDGNTLMLFQDLSDGA